MKIGDILIYPVIFETPKRIVPPFSWAGHIPFAFFLIEQLRPKRLVELGVHIGNSYNAFCQAVKTLGTQTACYGVDTWQGDEHAGFYHEDIYTELFAYQQQEYHEFSQLMRMTFEEASAYFADQTIDLLHIDGCHRYCDVRYDFESWLPKVSNKGVVLFHDTQVRRDEFGVWRLWQELSTQYPSFEFRHGYGLGVLAVGKQVEQTFLDLLQEFSTALTYQNLFGRLGEAITLSAEKTELTNTLHRKEELIYQLSSHDYAQLFFDTGFSFNETQSITKHIQGQERTIEFELSEYADICYLRFDPANAPAAIHLVSIELLGMEGERYPITTYQTNACHENGSNFIFDTDDPMITFASPAARLQKVVIALEYVALGNAAYPYIYNKQAQQIQQQAQQIQQQAQQHDEVIRRYEEKLSREIHSKTQLIQIQDDMIQTMENTLSWKITKPLRVIRNYSAIKQWADRIFTMFRGRNRP